MMKPFEPAINSSNIKSDTLNESIILQHCSPYFAQSLPHVHVLSSVDSTNEYLKNLPSCDSITLCCADEQTKGRGRLGRHWYSPAGENIYCSIRWHHPYPLFKLPALSLIIALAVLAAFKTLQIHAEIEIKWPNDLYWKSKKLGGILIETTSLSSHDHLIIVGIGLNINTKCSTEYIQNKLDRPWCSLYDITDKFWDRNQIIGILLGTVHQYVQRYLIEGFTPFLPDWEKVDWLYGQKVEVTRSHTHSLTGIASGITENGQLRLIDAQGEVHLIFSGEVTQFSTVN